MVEAEEAMGYARTSAVAAERLREDASSDVRKRKPATCSPHRGELGEMKRDVATFGNFPPDLAASMMANGDALDAVFGGAAPGE
jgi:hypothetical protein